MVKRFFPRHRYIQYDGANWTPRDIQAIDAEGFVRLDTNGSSYPPNSDSLVISADGACEFNGKSYAEAAYGVFVGGCGPAASWNEHGRVRSKATSQRAELVAAIRAVTVGIKLARRLSPDEFVVKMDSIHVVRGITQWIVKWKRNGWSTRRGKNVANRALWRALDLRIRQLESKHQIPVLFWHVPRLYNEDAVKEASRGLF